VGKIARCDFARSTSARLAPIPLYGDEEGRRRRGSVKNMRRLRALQAAESEGRIERLRRVIDRVHDDHRHCDRFGGGHCLLHCICQHDGAEAASCKGSIDRKPPDEGRWGSDGGAIAWPSRAEDRTGPPIRR